MFFVVYALSKGVEWIGPGLYLSAQTVSQAAQEIKESNYAIVFTVLSWYWLAVKAYAPQFQPIEPLTAIKLAPGTAVSAMSNVPVQAKHDATSFPAT